MAVSYEYDPWTPAFNPLKIPDWFTSIEPPVNAIKMGVEADNLALQRQAKEQGLFANQMKIDELLRNEEVNNAIAEMVRTNGITSNEQLLTTAKDEYLKAGAFQDALKIADDLERRKAQAEARDQSARDRDLNIVSTFARINPRAAWNIANSTGVAEQYGLTPQDLVMPREPKVGRRQTANDLKPYMDKATGEIVYADVYHPLTYQMVVSGRLTPYKEKSALELMLESQFAGSNPSLQYPATPAPKGQQPLPQPTMTQQPQNPNSAVIKGRVIRNSAARQLQQIEELNGR